MNNNDDRTEYGLDKECVDKTAEHFGIKKEVIEKILETYFDHVHMIISRVKFGTIFKIRIEKIGVLCNIKKGIGNSYKKGLPKAIKKVENKLNNIDGTQDKTV